SNCEDPVLGYGSSCRRGDVLMKDMINQQLPLSVAMIVIITFLAVAILVILSACALSPTLSDPEHSRPLETVQVRGKRALILRVVSASLAVGAFLAIVGGFSLTDSSEKTTHRIYSGVEKEVVQTYTATEITHDEYNTHRWVATLGADDWENRAQVNVLLESGEVATYEIAFDEDGKLTLYPINNTTVDPENLRR